MFVPATVQLPILDRLQIASPCSARWEDMTGDERTRHCGQCNLAVHNISAMTRPEAEAFLARHFDGDKNIYGRVCAQFYRRADGTILTAECPVGLAAVRARARRTLARAAAAVGLTTLVAWAAARESQSAQFAYSQPLATIAAWLRQPTAPPPPTPPLRGKIAMGMVVAPRFVPPVAPAAPVPSPKQTATEGAHR
jgi:hypothetical protein